MDVVHTEHDGTALPEMENVSHGYTSAPEVLTAVPIGYEELIKHKVCVLLLLTLFILDKNPNRKLISFKQLVTCIRDLNVTDVSYKYIKVEHVDGRCLYRYTFE